MVDFTRTNFGLGIKKSLHTQTERAVILLSRSKIPVWAAGEQRSTLCRGEELTGILHREGSNLICLQHDHRSAATLGPLWKMIRGWKSFLYSTVKYVVYTCFIDDGDHLVKKTYMTRVEGENRRLRHYLARLKRRTLCYSKTVEMLGICIKLLLC
jgi:insertion element IS1 protein InsB